MLLKMLLKKGFEKKNNYKERKYKFFQRDRNLKEKKIKFSILLNIKNFMLYIYIICFLLWRIFCKGFLC